jgi:ArsR family transcriptional regulator
MSAVHELPVLDRAPVEACCSPLQVVPLAEDEAVPLARRFAALSDPVRLRLLSLLATADGGAVCVCDLVEPVGKSQPTVSHHLRILREAGLVTSEKRGTNVWYAVVPAALESLREALRPVGPVGGGRR